MKAATAQHKADAPFSKLECFHTRSLDHTSFLLSSSASSKSAKMADRSCSFPCSEHKDCFPCFYHTATRGGRPGCKADCAGRRPGLSQAVRASYERQRPTMEQSTETEVAPHNRRSKRLKLQKTSLQTLQSPTPSAMSAEPAGFQNLYLPDIASSIPSVPPTMTADLRSTTDQPMASDVSHQGRRKKRSRLPETVPQTFEPPTPAQLESQRAQFQSPYLTSTFSGTPSLPPATTADFAPRTGDSDYLTTPLTSATPQDMQSPFSLDPALMSMMTQTSTPANVDIESTADAEAVKTPQDNCTGSKQDGKSARKRSE